MSEEKKRNPVVTGVLVGVIGLLVALLLGLTMMKVGRSRMEAAQKTEKPYLVAFGTIAQGGVEAVGRAQGALSGKNWGQAQQALDDVGKVVTQMESAVSEANRDQVAQVRQALGDAQAAVGKQGDDAASKVQKVQDLLQQFAAEAK